MVGCFFFRGRGLGEYLANLSSHCFLRNDKRRRALLGKEFLQKPVRSALGNVNLSVHDPGEMIHGEDVVETRFDRIVETRIEIKCVDFDWPKKYSIPTSA